MSRTGATGATGKPGPQGPPGISPAQVEINTQHIAAGRRGVARTQRQLLILYVVNIIILAVFITRTEHANRGLVAAQHRSEANVVQIAATRLAQQRAGYTICNIGARQLAALQAFAVTQYHAEQSNPFFANGDHSALKAQRLASLRALLTGLGPPSIVCGPKP